MLRVATDHYSHSDTGRARRANEDAYYARSPLFVVADGMGGAQAGEVASRVAVEVFERGIDEAGGSASAEQLLAGRVQEANARIHEMSQAEQERAGMGTTLTAVHVGEHDVAIAHVGDSRAYRLRGDDLQRLTDDHSLVEEMRRRGQLTAQEADSHPQRSIITRALGPEPEVDVDTHSWRGAAGDVYLLCSDGLTSMISETNVAGILRSSDSLGEAGRALVDAANEAGGRDNITVVLFRLEEVGGDAPVLEQPTSTGRSGPTTSDVRTAIAGTPPPGPAPAPEPEPAPGPAPLAPPAQSAGPREPAPPPRRLEPAAPPAPATKRARRARRAAKAFAIVAIVVLPICFGGYFAAQAVYFVGVDRDGFVTVYRGLPYALPAGLELYTVSYVSGVPLKSVPAPRRKRLVDHQLRSHDDAADLVRQLERGQIAS